MRCVVTGGLGFIGSNLVDALINDNHEVIVVDNLHSGFTSFINREAITIKADINSCFASEICKTLEKKIEQLDIDVIFHLAAETCAECSQDDPIYTFNTNVTGTLNVLEFAKQTNAKFIYGSCYSCSLIDSKLSQNTPYSTSKWFGEETSLMYNRIHSVPVAIARISNVYGPRQPSIGKRASVIGVFEQQKKAKSRLTVMGDGLQTRDFIHVHDVVEALLSMSDQKWNGEIFDVGSGENYSIMEIATLFEATIKYVPSRKNDIKDFKSDIYLTKEKLNWQPHHDLEDYIDDFLDANFPLAALRILNFWNKFKENLTRLRG